MTRPMYAPEPSGVREASSSAFEFKLPPPQANPLHEARIACHNLLLRIEQAANGWSWLHGEKPADVAALVADFELQAARFADAARKAAEARL